MDQNPYESPQDAANVTPPVRPVRPVGPGEEPPRPGDWLRTWGQRVIYVSVAVIFAYCGGVLLFGPFLFSKSVAMGGFGLLVLCLLAGLALMFVGVALNVFRT